VPRVWTRGKAVVDGVIQYLSPSQIASADAESYGGCPRRWWFNKVAGKKEPTSKSQAVGINGHGQIEHYLRTGQKALDRTILAGRHYIPDQDLALLIEHSIDDGELTASGIPVVGYIDLVIPRLPKSVEIRDWKFTGNLDYATPSNKLPDMIPMIAYGEWAARHFGAPEIRLTHVYFSTKVRKSEKKSIAVTRSEISRRWNRVEGVARSMIDWARESECSRVPANTKSCKAYGGCPHATYCPTSRDQTLVDIFGAAGAAHLTGDTPMSLLQIPGLAAIKDQLKAAEAAAANIPDGPTFGELVLAVDKIVRSGHGIPNLTGEAAARWHNAPAPYGTLAQATLSQAVEIVQLAQELNVPDPEPGFKDSVKELAGKGSATPPEIRAMSGVPAILPPDAPKSKPELAAEPVEGFSPAPVVGDSILIYDHDSVLIGKAANVVTDPVKGHSTPEAVAEACAAAESPVAAALELLKGSKCGKKDRQNAAEVLEAEIERLRKNTVIAPSGPVFMTVGEGTHTAEEIEAWRKDADKWRKLKDSAANAKIVQYSDDGIRVFVDCYPEVPAKSLDRWADELAAKLAENCGAADIRCAPEKSPLAFGKWKGALAALVRESELEPGVYVIDSRTEFASVVAEAIRPRCAPGGYTRGMR
jgi:hypothetical protein